MRSRTILSAAMALSILPLSRPAASQSNSAKQSPSKRPSRDALIWAPLPLTSFDDPELKPTIPKEMVASVRINNLSVVLEQTSLRSVQKALGGTIGSEGDASDYVQWLCLSGTTANQRWVLWLEAGEIDGGNVGAVVLRQIAPGTKLDPRCTVLQSGEGVRFPCPCGLE
jgi:hypothetical protein